MIQQVIVSSEDLFHTCLCWNVTKDIYFSIALLYKIVVFTFYTPFQQVVSLYLFGSFSCRLRIVGKIKNLHTMCQYRFNMYVCNV